MTHIKKIVLGYIDKYAKKKHETYENNMVLTDDLGYSSLTFVCLIMEIEEAFDFSFEDDYLDMDTLKTVGDILEYTNKKVKSDDIC